MVRRLSQPNWRIYYADGQRFSSNDGTPEQAPGYGVVCIRQSVEHDDLFNETYYFWHKEKQCWFNVDFIGLVDWLVTDAKNISTLKVGRTVTRKEFKELMRRSSEDTA